MKYKLPKIIWITSIFALLIVILLMVMDYKINYQYSNKIGSKLYFYDCDGKVCTTTTKNKNKKLYSEYTCYNLCPSYKGTINNDYVILKENSGLILYNYKLGIKITEGYDEYKFIDDKYIIVTKTKLDGIIDLDNNIIINPEYTQIGYYKKETLIGYNNESIIVRKDDTYGILNYKTGELVEEFTHKESEINKLLNIIKTS